MKRYSLNVRTFVFIFDWLPPITMLKPISLLLFLFLLCSIPARAQDTTYASTPGFSWKKHQSANFTYYAESGTFPDQHIDIIKSGAEQGRRAIFSFLGATQTGNNAIFVVHSRERMKALIGLDVQGFAIAEKKVLFLLYSEVYKPAISHELCHLYAFQILGPPKDAWINEGLAVYYDGTWSGYSIDLLAKHLKDNRKLFKLTALFKNLYDKNAMIAYPQIGSFTRYLAETYGMNRLKQFWTGGMKEASTIFGKKPAALEKEWLASLEKYDARGITYLSDLAKQ